MGEWEGDRWSWSWRWGRPLWDYEFNSLNALTNVINRCSANGSYSTKETYSMILNLDRDAQFNEETLKGFKLIWKSSAPMKVIAHAWRLIWGRLPTKSNLRRRGILKPTNDLRCIFCGHQEETEKHIFFECTITHGIWMECFAWFQCSTRETCKETCHLYLAWSCLAYLKMEKCNHLQKRGVFFNETRQRTKIETLELVCV
ncbi:hypothetical protein ACS0TY_020750 [Phlomoides rotata]